MTERPDVALVLGRFGTGGVERVACLLANGFAAEGLDVQIAVASRSGPALGLVDRRIEVVELLGAPSAGNRGLGLLRSVPALARYLATQRPRVLLSPGNHTHVAAALAHRLSGADSRLVVKITNPILKAAYGPVRKAVRKRLYAWIFDRCDRILVLSPSGIDRVAEINRAAAARTRFVHNPYVATEQLTRAAPAAENASDEPPTVLAVGRLMPQKNYPMLLRALARLGDRPWRLLFLGEGPERQKLQDQAVQLGIAERVHFKGFVDDPWPYYASARVLALPSTWEDLPAVVLEALASGCPVVATACSEAVAAVVQEAQGGGLVPVGDESAFAEQLEKRLSRPPERRPFAGAQAYSLEAGVRDHLDAIGLSDDRDV